jgi:hypothetical protein
VQGHLTRNLTLAVGAFADTGAGAGAAPLVVSAPSALESTAIVATLGVDHYVTRTSPSKGFDTLGDNFDYGLLFGAMGLLSAATLAAGGMVARGKRNKAWL